MRYHLIFLPIFLLTFSLSTHATFPTKIKKNREIVLADQSFIDFIKNYVDIDAMMATIKTDNFLKRLYPYYLAKERAAGRSGSPPEVIAATLVAYHHDLRLRYEVGQFQHESAFIYYTLNMYVQELRATKLADEKSYKEFLISSPELPLLPQFRSILSSGWRKGDDRVEVRANPNLKLYEVRRLLTDLEERVGVKPPFPFDEIDSFFSNLESGRGSCADLFASFLI